MDLLTVSSTTDKCKTSLGWVLDPGNYGGGCSRGNGWTSLRGLPEITVVEAPTTTLRTTVSTSKAERRLGLGTFLLLRPFGSKISVGFRGTCRRSTGGFHGSPTDTVHHL